MFDDAALKKVVAALIKRADLKELERLQLKYAPKEEKDAEQTPHL